MAQAVSGPSRHTPHKALLVRRPKHHVCTANTNTVAAFEIHLGERPLETFGTWHLLAWLQPPDPAVHWCFNSAFAQGQILTGDQLLAYQVENHLEFDFLHNLHYDD